MLLRHHESGGGVGGLDEGHVLKRPQDLAHERAIGRIVLDMENGKSRPVRGAVARRRCRLDVMTGVDIRRNADPKTTSCSRRAGKSDGSAHEFHQTTAEGEPNSSPFD